MNTVNAASDWLLLQEPPPEVPRTTRAHTETLNGIRTRRTPTNQTVVYWGRHIKYIRTTRSRKLMRSRWMTRAFRVPCVMWPAD